MADYEIHAIRYAHLARRTARENFLKGYEGPADEHDGPMPMDYFVWSITGGGKTFIVDTGFDRAMSEKRGRTLVRPVGEGLKLVGIDPATVDDVIITHMHYDHAGNHDLFPRARFHLQDREMAFCTGRCMCDGSQRKAYEAEDVATMVRRLFEGRLCFHDGDSQIAEDLSVHLIGGHTRGTQCVRVKTARGWVVLASDASHYYANFEEYRPFPFVSDVDDMIAGYTRMRELASSVAHIVPGHDPLVLDRYPAMSGGPADIVRLDVAR